MNIQVGHSREFDFVQDLYQPLMEASFFSRHHFTFPHNGQVLDSKESLKGVDIFLAEVSYPSTGLGIELGFASIYGKKIICLYKKGRKISSSIISLNPLMIEYDDLNDMIQKIETFLQK